MRLTVLTSAVGLVMLLQACTGDPATTPSATDDASARCSGLLRSRNLTLIYAQVLAADGAVPGHCYVKGLIDGSITFHAQLPLPEAWNGRLVHLGDGGADGDLDFQNDWLARGYAVANSNTGHDSGPSGEAFAFEDDRAANNFTHRAVHLTAAAAKSTVLQYYGREQDYAYHVGCSTGGRQALVAAQLYPYDFDGIVAGAPGHRQFERMAHRLDVEQHLFRDHFAANLAFDADGDGRGEDLSKVDLLARSVVEKCDALDGIEDGIIEPPLCDFDPRTDLADVTCSEDEDRRDCFTGPQLGAIEHLYRGSTNSRGELVYPGAPLGSEPSWPGVFIPHQGNGFVPYVLRSASAVIGYSYYRDDPGVIPPDLSNVDYQLDRDAEIPEWGWWEFDIDDIGSDRGTDLAGIMRGSDPDLDRFLLRSGGKLLLYHGWADAVIPPEPTLEYRSSVVSSLFGGDSEDAAEHLRLFMAPGVGHCRGGVGPDRADYLAALADWVERGVAPERIVARHYSDVDGREQMDNERPLCVFPKRAVYRGPEGGANDRVNWVEGNFDCRLDR